MEQHAFKRNRTACDPYRFLSRTNRNAISGGKLFNTHRTSILPSYRGRQLNNKPREWETALLMQKKITNIPNLSLPIPREEGSNAVFLMTKLCLSDWKNPGRLPFDLHYHWPPFHAKCLIVSGIKESWNSQRSMLVYGTVCLQRNTNLMVNRCTITSLGDRNSCRPRNNADSWNGRSKRGPSWQTHWCHPDSTTKGDCDGSMSNVISCAVGKIQVPCSFQENMEKHAARKSNSMVLVHPSVCNKLSAGVRCLLNIQS